jgi:copper chaperone CopZ
MKTILSIIVLLVAAVLLFAAGDKEKKAATKLELKISGMTCAGCAANVEKAVRNDKNVAGVQVDWKKGVALVGFKERIDGNACLPLFAELKKAGYTLEEIKDEAGAAWSVGITCCGPQVYKKSDK